MTPYLAILWACGALAAVIFGVMLWSVATFQGEKHGRRAGAASYLHSAPIEVLWALIPIVILIAAATPALRMLPSVQ